MAIQQFTDEDIGASFGGTSIGGARGGGGSSYGAGGQMRFNGSSSQSQTMGRYQGRNAVQNLQLDRLQNAYRGRTGTQRTTTIRQGNPTSSGRATYRNAASQVRAQAEGYRPQSSPNQRKGRYPGDPGFELNPQARPYQSGSASRGGQRTRSSNPTQQEQYRPRQINPRYTRGPRNRHFRTPSAYPHRNRNTEVWWNPRSPINNQSLPAPNIPLRGFGVRGYTYRITAEFTGKFRINNQPVVRQFLIGNAIPAPFWIYEGVVTGLAIGVVLRVSILNPETQLIEELRSSFRADIAMDRATGSEVEFISWRIVSIVPNANPAIAPPYNFPLVPASPITGTPTRPNQPLIERAQERERERQRERQRNPNTHPNSDPLRNPDRPQSPQSPSSPQAPNFPSPFNFRFPNPAQSPTQTRERIRLEFRYPNSSINRPRIDPFRFDVNPRIRLRFAFPWIWRDEEPPMSCRYVPDPRIAQLQQELAIVQNKLGQQLPFGGIGGMVARIFRATIFQKALAAINLAATTHNAVMLSNAAAQSLVWTIDELVQALGITFESADGGQSQLSEVIGTNIENTLNEIFGEERVDEVQSLFVRVNRIYQASANLLYTLQSIYYSMAEILETIADRINILGNALRRSGQIMEPLWDSMVPDNFETGRFRRLGRTLNFIYNVTEVLDQIAQIASEVREIGEQINEFQEQSAALRAEFEQAKEQGQEIDNQAATAAQQAGEVTESDLN